MYKLNFTHQDQYNIEHKKHMYIMLGPGPITLVLMVTNSIVIVLIILLDLSFRYWSIS